MKTTSLACVLIAATLVAPPALAQFPGRDSGYQLTQGRGDWRGYRNYDFDRLEAGQDRYDAARYYRHGRYYPDTRLSHDDRIYHGTDDRYYCRRRDGTTGLIVGGVAGGVLGDLVEVGGSNTLGALFGAAGGALAGRAIDRHNVRCD